MVLRTVTEPLVIGDIFRNAARAVPQRTAAALGDRRLTFAEVDDLGNRTARVLADLGVGTGDRVATWAGTTLDAVPIFAALAKLGAVFVPLNGLWGAEEVAAPIRRCDPALVLVDAAHAGAATAFADNSGSRVHQMEVLVASAASWTPVDPAAKVQETDAHVVFFTSGSSGAPKGVVLSHRANVLRSLPGALLEPRGAMVCPYPLFHMGAWTIALQQWQARDAVVFVSSASAEQVGAAVQRHHATRLNAIPAVWRRLLDALSGSEPPDLSTLRFADTGTSATPPELLRAMTAALPGAQVRVFYGSTEAGSVTVLEHADTERKPGSCGVPGPLVSVRTDAAGQLLVRGPQLFDGYLDDPVATDAAFVDDGWFATGDLADVDGDGYLTIVGRVGEVIRTGGEAVAPSEVERVLGTHPQVADVAVVGLPDEQWGELVCAVVVPDDSGPPPELGELRELCAALASFKHPRRLYVVDRIPRTAATGQVQRRLLVEQLA